MIQKLPTVSTDTLLLLQRATLAAVIFPHGAQKLLGWFGGYGYAGTMKFFTETVGLPGFIGFLVILGESIGALALLAGLGSRLTALWITAIMVGAVLTTHLEVGFFMNWFGNQPGEGFEFHLLALALSLGIVLRGGGRFALDDLLRALTLSRRARHAPFGPASLG